MGMPRRQTDGNTINRRDVSHGRDTRNNRDTFNSRDVKGCEVSKNLTIAVKN
jgi:hypothetical protein